MRVYSGYPLRQVGGGLWSTIQRGVRPAIHSFLKFIKPHATKAGKELAKSALNAGTNLASDAIKGTMTRAKFNQAVKDVRNQAADQVSELKRRLIDQQGSGAKRRKVSKKPRKTAKKKPVQKSKQKSTKSKVKSTSKQLRKVSKKSKAIKKKTINKNAYKHNQKAFHDIFS